MVPHPANHQVNIAPDAGLLGAERLVAEPGHQRIAEEAMLATGCRDDRGRDAREKTIVGLTLWVLVVHPVPRVTRGRRAAVVYVLPGANIGEGKVVGREA